MVTWRLLGDGCRVVEEDLVDRHSVVLRPATPTEDDGLAFAHYLDVAAEGFFRLMLGPRVASILATAFALPDHDLSYQHVTFAERDGSTVGMVSGYTAEQHRRSSRQPLTQAAGKGNVRMWLVGTLFTPLMRVIDSVAEDDFYVLAIAVDEEVRGSGVGALLLDTLEQRARQSGSRRLALDVSAGNEKALGFYERRGMTIESQWPKRVWIPGLKLYRMVKVLE